MDGAVAKPRVKVDADEEAPTGAKEGPGDADTTGASVGVMLVNRFGPEAETGKEAEMGMVSEAEDWVGCVVGAEMGSEDDTGTEETGLARGEELGTGSGEEAGPGRGEETVKGAVPGADTVETKNGLAPESCYSLYSIIPPFPSPPNYYPQNLYSHFMMLKIQGI